MESSGAFSWGYCHDSVHLSRGATVFFLVSLPTSFVRVQLILGYLALLASCLLNLPSSVSASVSWSRSHGLSFSFCLSCLHPLSSLCICFCSLTNSLFLLCLLAPSNSFCESLVRQRNCGSGSGCHPGWDLDFLSGRPFPSCTYRPWAAPGLRFPR